MQIEKKKKARVGILISDKIDFKAIDYNKRQRRTLHNDKENNPRRKYKNVNIYVPKIGAHKYIKQILTDIEGETDSNTVRVGGFNTPLISMDRSSRQKINKETLALNDTLAK